MNKDQFYMQSARIYKPWQKITSLFTLFFFLFQIPTIAFAQALHDGVIQAHFNSEPQFEPSNSISHLFQPASYLVEANESYYSIEDFKKRLEVELKGSLGAVTYVPVSVGDITSFIPVYKSTHYKSVGTSFVQSRYVRAQVVELLGRTLIDPDDKVNFGTEAQQLIRLYNNAFDYARFNTNVTFGQKLSLNREEAPMDMIWPELRSINGQKVFVPVVYLSQATVSNRRVESHITEFDGDLTGFKNIRVRDAEIKFGRDSFIEVVNKLILNNGSIISEGDLEVVAGGTLKLLSSQIDANGDLNIAAHGIEAQTIVHRYDLGKISGTKYDVITNIESNGNMVIRSFQDINVAGSSIYAGGSITLAADGNIRIGTEKFSSHQRTKNGHWRGTRDTVDYLQSTLTAEETIQLISNSRIIIDAAELISNEGHIKLLASMGITIENEFSSVQKKAKYRTSKKKRDVSSYETVAIRAALDAGKGVTIHSDFGNITLRAVDIDASNGTSVSASNGSVNLLIAKETDHYSYHSVSKRMFSTRTVSRGHNIETAVYPTITGGLTTNALYGLNVDFVLDQDLSRDEQLDTLANLEGMSWLNDIRENDQVLWNEIQLVNEHWHDGTTTLNASAMAMISIAVAIAMGPGGLAIAGSSMGVAAANAGMAALVTQASISLASGNSIGDTLEKLAEEETLKSVAISMVTAAAISGIDAEFFTPESTEVFGKAKELSLGMQATQAVVHSAASASISTVVNGGSLSDFGDAFTTTLMQSAISRIGQEMAETIGDSYKTGDITNAVRYMAHAATGCIIGVASGEVTNTETSSDNNCASGAGGAVTGELIADWHKEANGFEQQQELVKELEKELLDSLGPLATADPNNLTDEQAKAIAALQTKIGNHQSQQAALHQMRQQGVDLAKLGAGFAALAAGGNVQLAADAGENAAKHNALFVIPLIKFSLAAYSAIQAYLAIEEFKEKFADIKDFQSLSKAEQDKLITDLGYFILEEAVMQIFLKGADKGLDALIKIARENGTASDILDSLENIAVRLGAGQGSELNITQANKEVLGDIGNRRFDTDKLSEKELLDLYENEVKNGSLTKTDLQQLQKDGYIFDADTKRFSKPERNFDVTATKSPLPDVELDYTGLKVTVGKGDQEFTMDELVTKRKDLVNQRDQLSSFVDDSPAYNKLNAEISKISESMGELSKEAYVKKLDAQPLAFKTPGNGQQGQFDGIYTYFKDGEERLLIIEAKGGNSSLGGRRAADGRYVQQGTSEYRESIIENMQKSVDKADVYEDVADLDLTLDKLDEFTGKVDYQLVQQKLDPQSGSLLPTLISKFDQG